VSIDPIAQFRQWRAEVEAAGLHEPDAMVLCTAPATADAQPLGRHVLLRGLDDRGFAFVTNRTSRKGRHLAENPNACLVFPWHPLRRQVVVTGTVSEASDEESDAYWRTRPRGSQIASSVSEQSTPIPDRAWLEDRFAELEARYEGREVPRPPHWGMLRLRPDSIEFWTQGENRMHDRLLYERSGDRWIETRLSP
jgi:pyridoxamine 5'-phosphate oxidase